MVGGTWAVSIIHRTRLSGPKASSLGHRRKTDNRTGDSRYTSICRCITFKKTWAFGEGEGLGCHRCADSNTLPLVEWKSPWLLCLDSFPGNQTKVYFRDICNKNTWAFSLHHTCFWTPFGDVYWAQMRLALQTVFSITWEKGSSYLHFLDLEKLDSWAELCKFGCYITLHVAIFVVLGDGPKSKSQPSQGLG